MRAYCIPVLVHAVAMHAAFFVPSCAGFALVLAFLALLQLRHATTTRFAFYAGTAAGLAVVIPHLLFFAGIFGLFACVLWLLLAMWHGWFVLLVGALHRRSPRIALAVAPVVWMGLEFFRCEVWPLKFAYLTPGFMLPMDPGQAWLVWNGLMSWVGLYGCALVFMALAAAAEARRNWWLRVVATLAGGSLALLPPQTTATSEQSIVLAGVQLEFPDSDELRRALDSLALAHPSAAMLVCSELTLPGDVPAWLSTWCMEHKQHVVIGGLHRLEGAQTENTVWVVDPDGKVVHRQVKSVPVQFFRDGRPATERTVWASPMGRLGFCICYDLNYRRVTDDLATLGMQALIVPTMDLETWGLHQHELGARLTAIRAVENGVPVFRLTSSGISVATLASGEQVARTAFGKRGEQMVATLPLSVQARVPWDRWPAELSVWITGLIAAGLLFAKWRRHASRAAATAAARSRSRSKA